MGHRDRVDQRMSALRTESELLTSIVAALRGQMSAAACSVALLDGDELEFRVADGVGAPIWSWGCE
jgi:signal transduction protein with GAF and PtsI domain